MPLGASSRHLARRHEREASLHMRIRCRARPGAVTHRKGPRMSGCLFANLVGVGVGVVLAFAISGLVVAWRGASRAEGAGLDNAAAEPFTTGERAAEHGIVDPALPAPSVQARTIHCVRCDSELEAVDTDSHQPYRGVIFQALGNYGSSVYDPYNESHRLVLAL